MLAGAYPSRRVRRAQAAGHLGPDDRRRRPAGATPGSSPSRAAGRSRTAGCSASSWSARPGRPAGGSASSTRRWSTRAGPARSSRSGRAAGGSRRSRHDRVTVSPAPGVPGQAAVLARRRGRPADRARPGARSVRRRGRGGPRPRRARPRRGHRRGFASTTTSTSSPPRTSSRISRTSAKPPARCRPTGGSSSSASATSSATGGLCLLTPFGGRVHAPWSLAIEARLGERLAGEVRTIWSDDGIAIRLPDGDDVARAGGGGPLPGPRGGRGHRRRAGRLVGAVRVAVPRERRSGTAPAAPPARHPDAALAATPAGRRPARRRLAAMAASRSSSRRTARCLSDVFDLPALRDVLGGIARREIAIHSVETPRASPFASSLLFDYVAAYMYDGDAPMAERRAGALTLDRDLLRELLGQEELRELLDPDALADLELGLQALTEDRAADDGRPAPRPPPPPRRPLGRRDRRPRARAAPRRGDAWLTELIATRRAVPARIAGDDRWIAIEDVARYRDGVGVVAAAGRARRLPRARRGRPGRAARPLRPDPWPVRDARAGARAGACPSASSTTAWSGCSRAGRSSAASSGRAAPSANGSTRTSSACSAAVRWPGCAGRSSRSTPPRTPGSSPRGTGSRPWASAAPLRQAALERLAEVVDQLAGVALPASVLERDILLGPGYQPRLLDELGAMGEVAGSGAGASAATTGGSRCSAGPRGPQGELEAAWSALDAAFDSGYESREWIVRMLACSLLLRNSPLTVWGWHFMKTSNQTSPSRFRKDGLAMAEQLGKKYSDGDVDDHPPDSGKVAPEGSPTLQAGAPQSEIGVSRSDRMFRPLTPCLIVPRLRSSPGPVYLF